MDQIFQKGYFRPKTKKVNIPIEFCIFELVLTTKFRLQLTIFIFWTKFPKKSISGRKQKKWTASLNSAYSNYARCYGTSRPIKKALTIYGTDKLCGKLAIENNMALLGQVRESWPSMAPLGHVELTKTLWHFLGQSRESWLSMAPLGHVELTKMQKLLESKN